MPSSLLSLPNEIHLTIVSSLDCLSLARISIVNHHFHGLLEANKSITRDALLKAEIHTPEMFERKKPQSYLPCYRCLKCIKTHHVDATGLYSAFAVGGCRRGERVCRNCDRKQNKAFFMMLIDELDDQQDVSSRYGASRWFSLSLS